MLTHMQTASESDSANVGTPASYDDHAWRLFETFNLMVGFRSTLAV